MFGRGKRQADTRAAGDQDDDAIADLYARFAHRVHAYALQRVRDPEVAADIASMTFVRALNALSSFSLPDPANRERALEGWVLAIARNVVIDQVRADQRLTILDSETYQDRLADHAQDPANAAVDADERERLLDALGQLNTTQQRIVLLRLQGWNGVEIAELLGMTHGAVRIAQYRAYGASRSSVTSSSIVGSPP